VTEEEIHSTFENLIAAVTGMLRDREASLISDVETIKQQKEKELQLQKDDLEFLVSGIRHAVLFGEAMVKEGSETEIVAGHQQVVARMATLTKEREKAQVDPVMELGIELVGGGQQGADFLSSAIKELGGVINRSISAENSIITETPKETHHLISQAYSFKVVLKDKTGNRISTELMRKAVKSLAVEVTGPSKMKVCPCIHSFTLGLDLSF